MPSFFRLLLGLFLILYAFTLIFIAVNAKKVLSQGNDFQAQYGAAKLIVEGKNIYDLTEEARVQQAATGRQTSIAEVVPFINSPLAVVWLAPLGHMSFQMAYGVWGIFLYVLLLFMFWIISQIYDLARLKKTVKTVLDEKGFFLLVAIVMHWSVIALFAGQLSLILAVGLFGSFLLLHKKKDAQAGVALSLVCVKPYLLFIPLVMLLYKRRYVSVAWCLVGIACFAVAAVGLVGLPAFGEYSDLGKNLFWIGDEPMKIHLSRQITGRALVYVATGGAGAAFTLMQAVIWGLLSVLIVYAATRQISTTPTVSPKEWALAILVMVFTGIHMHGHDGIILLFPLVVWYARTNLNIYIRMGALVMLAVAAPVILFYAGFLISVCIASAVLYLYYLTFHSYGSK